MTYDITKRTPPPMPPLKGKGLEAIHLLLSQASPDMRAPLLPMLFPVVGARFKKTEFQYPSGQWMELCGQMGLLVADSCNNKGQLGTLADAVHRDSLQEDQDDLKRYLEYQKIVKKRSKNKDLPDEVELPARILPSDTTRAGFLKAQMANESHGGLTSFSNLPEIELLNALCGGKKQVMPLLRLIFDRQLWQARRGTTDGITGSATLRANICISSTPGRVRDFLKSNLFDGTVGRLIFSYKPRGENRDGCIPMVGTFSDEFYRRLDQYLVRIDLCTGRYVIPQLNKLIRRLALDMAEMADLTDNDVLWDYSKRSLISSFKAGCVMWALNNQEWTRPMAAVCEWLVYNDLWSKQAVLGSLLKEGDANGSDNAKTGPANMLDSIQGDTFSEQQLDVLREHMGKPRGADTKRQLRVWMARGFIEYSCQTGLYRKTEAYLKRTR